MFFSWHIFKTDFRYSKVLISFRYIRYLNGLLRNGRPRKGHIRHQRVQINTNQGFVFQISQNFILTVFRFFWRPYWIQDMNRKYWFAIPFKTMSWRIKGVNLKQNVQKLMTGLCRIKKNTKNRCDVIKAFFLWKC